MTVLITGASSGIGYELSRLFARDGYTLVLVARDEEGLARVKQELETSYKITAHILVKDLSGPTAAHEVFQWTTEHNLTIDVLVNNAGFGAFGLFHETDWEKERRMIELNVTTLTALTKFFVRGMVMRKKGRILNLASTAAFQPGPLMAVYYATKAYVLSFSEALSNELSGTGVTVTALCPGPTASGFQVASGMDKSSLVKGKKLPTSREVALYGYHALMRGKPVAIHGIQNRLGIFLERFIPRNLVVAIVRSIQKE